MKQHKARTQQEIFTSMHRELRTWNSEIPESPERLDPILKIILQLHASQLARMDQRIDRLWDIARNSLIRSLYPECKRWPVPAHVVMRCLPADPVVEVDPHTRFFYREKREGGQTFFFSSLRTEKLVKAEVKHVFVKTQSSLIDLSPLPEDTPPRAEPAVQLAPGESGRVYLGIDFEGNPAVLGKATVFLRGSDEVLKQIRWGQWYPSSTSGQFYDDSRFCPGLTSTIDDVISLNGERAIDWGGFRTTRDMFGRLENHFAILPESFTSTWQPGPAETTLADALASQGIALDSETGQFYWIRIDLSPRGDKRQLSNPLSAYFDAFIAVNKNEMTLFKHTGGNRLVEVELPEDLSNILDITKVVDSTGREYRPVHEIQPDPSHGSYSLEERDNKLVLWFDFSSSLQLPPDSLTVTYNITSGTDANGIEAGHITELYESHPGVESAESLTSTTGAIPAKTEEQVISEVSSRLRNRDRALSFDEIARWALSFDSRIKKATCSNGIERTAHGVRRCVVVEVTIAANDFYSDVEVDLMRDRLGGFLKSRAPVNTQFRVEIHRT